MKLFRAMETSVSALTAERLRMDLIANNLANINTTRTADGTPYRRRFAVQAERQESFGDLFAQQMAQANAAPGTGVRITAIGEDQSPFQLKHDPSHPDADEDGMVALPNVDMLQEITDMMVSVRVYEANVTAFNSGKQMALKALEIGR